MIKSISVQRFKSLFDVELELGPLNIFIGTNASGKSNFFDALRFLQGVGSGFSISEILDGKPKTSTSDVWEGIRGGSSKLGFRSAKIKPQKSSIEVTLSEPVFRYRIGLSPARQTVFSEELPDIFDSASVRIQPTTGLRVKLLRPGKGRRPHVEFERSRPVLQQLARQEAAPGLRDFMQSCLNALANFQRLDLSPSVLREYSGPRTVDRIGDRGENFAALVSRIMEDPAAKEAYTSWLTQLTPIELDQVKILHGALGEPLFAVEHGGHEFPAPVLSDGFLRFAAMSAALLQPDMPDVLMIEEVENGLHPTRLRLLVDLLKSQARDPRPQVMVTTHSPVILSWLDEADYATVFLCTKDPKSGESKITPLTRVPGLIELVRKQPLADLFAEGWLETAP